MNNEDKISISNESKLKLYKLKIEGKTCYFGKTVGNVGNTVATALTCNWTE